MADSYLAISRIANDSFMNERMRACVTQQVELGNVDSITSDPILWVAENNYRWASSPGWGEKWEYAMLAHPDDPQYYPGADPAAITDGDILSAVQFFGNQPAITQQPAEEGNDGGT